MAGDRAHDRHVSIDRGQQRSRIRAGVCPPGFRPGATRRRARRNQYEWKVEKRFARRGTGKGTRLQDDGFNWSDCRTTWLALRCDGRRAFNSNLTNPGSTHHHRPSLVRNGRSDFVTNYFCRGISLTQVIVAISLCVHFQLGPLDCAELPRHASPVSDSLRHGVSKSTSERH